VVRGPFVISQEARKKLQHGCQEVLSERAKEVYMLGIIEQIRAAYLEYSKLEGRLYTLISKLPRYGEHCDCERSEKIALRDEEVMVEYCAVCGGFTEEVI
jgi:hypothetical protein